MAARLVLVRLRAVTHMKMILNRWLATVHTCNMMTENDRWLNRPKAGARFSSFVARLIDVTTRGEQTKTAQTTPTPLGWRVCHAQREKGNLPKQ